MEGGGARMYVETEEDRMKKLREMNKNVYAELKERAARLGMTVREYQKKFTTHRQRKAERCKI